jgi:hypothetical protein
MKIKLLEEIFISQRSDLTIMDIGWWQYSILNIKATVVMFTTDEAFVTFFFLIKIGCSCGAQFSWTVDQMPFGQVP